MNHAISVAPLDVVVLAAGKGTRMRSAHPKVLQPLGGEPMLAHVLRAVVALTPQQVHLVVGHGQAEVREWAASQGDMTGPVTWVEQTEQLGTGHAVRLSAKAWTPGSVVLVAYGDVPLITPATLASAAEAARSQVVIITAKVAEPSGYGRIVRDASGQVSAIVEHADATPAQQAIKEINTGVIAAPADWLGPWLDALQNDNPKGEYYLTDVIAMAVVEGRPVTGLCAADAAELEGVNDRVQWARAERQLQSRRATALVRAGVTLADPARLDVGGGGQAGQDVSIDVGCILEGRVVLGNKVRIGPYCHLRDVELGDGAVIESHSVLEGVVTAAHVHVGPFARLRPGPRPAAKPGRPPGGGRRGGPRRQLKRSLAQADDAAHEAADADPGRLVQLEDDGVDARGEDRVGLDEDREGAVEEAAGDAEEQCDGVDGHGRSWLTQRRVGVRVTAVRQTDLQAPRATRRGH